MWLSCQDSVESNSGAISKVVVPAAVRRSVILTAGLWGLPTSLRSLKERRKQGERQHPVATTPFNKVSIEKAGRAILLPTAFLAYVVYPVTFLLLFRLPEQLSWLGLFQNNHQCWATHPRHGMACLRLYLAQAFTFLPLIGTVWLLGNHQLSKAAKWKFLLTAFLVGIWTFKLSVDHLSLFDDDAPLHGKVAVITGANQGIGLATALALAERGAHVVVSCRSLGRCAPVVDKIAKGGKGSASAVVFELTSLESAAKLAKQLVAEYPEINYFFANAGTTPRYELTREGFEDGFGGMHLAHMAVVLGILPSLQRGGTSVDDPARIVIVSSEMSINAAMGIFGNNLLFSTVDPENDLHDDWRGERTRGDGTIGSSLPAYGRAKLCGILFAFEINRRLKTKGIPVIAHAVHVGAVVTDSSRNAIIKGFPSWIPALRWITSNIFFPLLWRSVEGGSRCLLCPALSRAPYIVEGGQYLDALCRPFFHDREPNRARDGETTLTLPSFLSGEEEKARTIQLDPVQALLLADIRWSKRLWNVSLTFLNNSPAKDVVIYAP